ncbi:AraC family transcriptional regulator [Autumnicola edwardsiae]|uniref:AraC family transcriptional regulator n=1 Tax=Autumnicola edwardsiae TaxID=3075594 RepID=A0ABU3CWI3_9FLAO|nr:AraC family transcriptional regulator [Zunongwangia sp. F297]MDT0650636.1 AraC family transcriptional regulator [Zunongwangia sp. F297]
MTKPSFLKVFNTPGASIDIRHEKVPYFKNPWHFHPELELTLILEGSGTRFIGNRLDRFNKTELTLTGPNLPHYWHCDPIYYQKDHKLNAEAIIIRFPENFLGNGFFLLPEMYHINNLFKMSYRGIKITGDLKEQTANVMRTMMQMDGAERIIVLLQILNSLANSSEYQILSSISVGKTYKTADMKRINKVFEYLIKNFKMPIRLNKIASVANMNPSAFSRYFKAKTGKTFTEVLQEIRIEHACKILVEEDYTVSRACHECGYIDQSYFIKQFKRITHQTPLQYQSRHNKNFTI